MECNKTFTLKSTLDAHTKIHSGKKEFSCPVCNGRFTTLSSKKLHMRRHLGVKPFKCSYCPLQFRTSGHRKVHLMVHYKEANRQKEASLLTNDVINHLDNIIITDPQQDSQEINFDDLDENIKKDIESYLLNHQKASKEFECELCKKLFKNKYYLDRHLKIHLNQKEFKCEHCDKSFLQKAHLKGHMKVHSSLRPYNCPQCSNSFNSAGNLKTHIKR